MDLRPCAWSLALVLLGCTAPLAPQAAAGPQSSGSALVVSIPSDRLYHQPGCPLVAKAGKNVKVMRLSEANRRSLKAHDCRSAADGSDGSKAAEANAATVFVQDGDRRYHREKCERLTKDPQKATLDKAGRSHFPCPVCKPPIRQRPGA